MFGNRYFVEFEPEQKDDEFKSLKQRESAANENKKF
jgi:hypothetical protein